MIFRPVVSVEAMAIKHYAKTRFFAGLAAMALIFALLLCAGCSGDGGSGYVFKYDISSNPVTLDPQIADDVNSELVIRNVFMGLLTVNADGSLSEGVADDYMVSEDGLVYTFRLRGDLYWYTPEMEEPVRCTADDFVYAFQRLFLPETEAPRAGEYYCIKNSRPIHQGFIPDPALLGVRAKSELVLEITLETPNPRLPSLLTEPPAMPCNEKFFLDAQGKYGLSAECTPSNGAFYVKSWDYDPYTITDNNNLILRKNSKNAEALGVSPAGLNFFIEEDGSFAEDFLDGAISCVAVTDEQAVLIGEKYPCETFGNITVGLIFNQEFQPFSNENFRKALACLVDRDTAVSEHFAPAYAVVPSEVSMLDKPYRELAGDSMALPYDKEKAREYYRGAVGIDKDKFTGARIIVKDESAAQAVSYAMQEWQREFGFYCVVETLTESEYSARLSSGDFEIAAAELSGSYNSPAAYLEQFRKGNGANVGGFKNADFEKLMRKAATADDLSESADLYKQAESILLEKAGFVPLYYKNEYFYTDKDIAGIIYSPFTKTVDFTGAVKK